MTMCMFNIIIVIIGLCIKSRIPKIAYNIFNNFYLVFINCFNINY